MERMTARARARAVTATRRLIDGGDGGQVDALIRMSTERARRAGGLLLGQVAAAPEHIERCGLRIRHGGGGVLGAGEREVDLLSHEACDLEGLGDIRDLEVCADSMAATAAGMYGSAAVISGSEPVEVRSGPSGRS